MLSERSSDVYAEAIETVGCRETQVSSLKLQRLNEDLFKAYTQKLR